MADLQDNHDRFVSRVRESGVVWGLKSEEGWPIVPPTKMTAMCFCSGRTRPMPGGMRSMNGRATSLPKSISTALSTCGCVACIRMACLPGSISMPILRGWKLSQSDLRRHSRRKGNVGRVDQLRSCFPEIEDWKGPFERHPAELKRLPRSTGKNTEFGKQK